MAMCSRFSRERMARAWASARAKTASLLRIRVAVKARASWYTLL